MRPVQETYPLSQPLWSNLESMCITPGYDLAGRECMMNAISINTGSLDLESFRDQGFPPPSSPPDLSVVDPVGWICLDLFGSVWIC